VCFSMCFSYKLLIKNKIFSVSLSKHHGKMFTNATPEDRRGGRKCTIINDFCYNLNATTSMTINYIKSMYKKKDAAIPKRDGTKKS
jgi:hypothetical protein